MVQDKQACKRRRLHVRAVPLLSGLRASIYSRLGGHGARRCHDCSACKNAWRSLPRLQRDDCDCGCVSRSIVLFVVRCEPHTQSINSGSVIWSSHPQVSAPWDSSCRCRLWLPLRLDRRALGCSSRRWSGIQDNRSCARSMGFTPRRLSSRQGAAYGSETKDHAPRCHARLLAGLVELRLRLRSHRRSCTSCTCLSFQMQRERAEQAHSECSPPHTRSDSTRCRS